MANPLDERDVKHNRVARYQMLAKSWQKKYEGALHHSQKLQELWISGYYNKGYSRWHLINLMNRAVSAGVSYLAEGNPKVSIEPKAPKLRSFAYAMKLIVNFLIEKYDFADNVFIPGAVASYFGPAIARTFEEYDRCVSIDNELIKVGSPKVAIIEPCDYIGDPSVKVRADFAFEGDMYRLPTEYAKDLFARKNKYGKQVADYIQSDAKLTTKYSTEELTSKSGYDYNKMALEEFSTFMDIYNRKEKTIETIMPMGHKAIVIKTIDSPVNPYDYLGYRYPPNCPIPIPPAWDIYDLDTTTNVVADAERRKAEGQKEILAAEPTGKKAAEAVLKAKKGIDVVTVKGMDGVKQFKFGGVTNEGLAWLQFAEGEFQKAGSTTSDIFRGAGPTSDTLGQDQLVFSNAARMVNSYYTRFHNWMTSILRKWTNMVMDNPSSYVEVLDTVKVPGLGDYEYPVFYSKADKVAEFSQLILNVVPYSTQRKTPEMKYQSLLQLMTTWILPTMQLRRAQGADIDLQMVDTLLADYGGFDSFPEWYKSVLPGDNPQVDYLMKTGKQKKNPGQMSDQLGATFPSRAANSAGFDLRNGIGENRLTNTGGQGVQQ
jgi:hypothetical protein